MSFFGGDQKQGSANAWGGFFKQAISSVETRFDSLLDQDTTGVSNKNNGDDQDEETFTDTYVDPDSGMVTTIQRKRPKASTAAKQVDSTKAPESPKSNSQGKLPSNQPTSRAATDLSARLAAVMSEKAGRPSSPSNSGRSTPKPTTKDTTSTSQAKLSSEAKVEKVDDDPKDTDSTSQDKPSNETKVEKDDDVSIDANLTSQATTSNETKVEKDDSVSKTEDGEQPLVETDGEEAIIDKQQDTTSDEVEPEPTAAENASNAAKESEPQITEPEQTVDSTIPIANEEEKSENEDTKPQPLPESTSAAVEDNASTEHEASKVTEDDKVDTTETAAEYETSAENTENVEEKPSESINNEEDKPETIMEQAASSSEEPTVLVTDISTSVPKEDSAAKANEDEKWNAIIRQREEQVLSVMKSNAELHEQLHQLQDSSDAEIARLKSKIDEFMSSKGGNKIVEDLRSQLAGKDTQIQGLMAEGEALSKRELKHMNALKKLRAEKQESERSVQDLQKKIEKGSSDLMEANVKVARMTEAEKKNSGIIVEKRKYCN
ncbi:TATA element modulatory factor 1 DNA binding-domain-containing protein [Umbelopsis sp. AD052]|nr:TATA element modulatory factor 1 DNA binding-domain-containing protein [Umbelopsis sp. AD052]